MTTHSPEMQLVIDGGDAWKRHALRLETQLVAVCQTLRAADRVKRTWHTGEADAIAGKLADSRNVTESDINSAMDRYLAAFPHPLGG